MDSPRSALTTFTHPTTNADSARRLRALLESPVHGETYHSAVGIFLWHRNPGLMPWRPRPSLYFRPVIAASTETFRLIRARRRSALPTDIGSSGLAAGTGLHAPQRPL